MQHRPGTSCVQRCRVPRGYMAEETGGDLCCLRNFPSGGEVGSPVECKVRSSHSKKAPHLGRDVLGGVKHGIHGIYVGKLQQAAVGQLAVGVKLPTAVAALKDVQGRHPDTEGDLGPRLRQLLGDGPAETLAQERDCWCQFDVLEARRGSAGTNRPGAASK